jgi:hypothetical protein
MKSCPKCGATRPLSFFSSDISKKDGLNVVCRECQSTKNKASYAKNRERNLARVRAWNLANPQKRALIKKRGYLKSAYGLSWEDYEKRMSEQSGQCAICKGSMSPAFVDHDHTTGKVRGLLCNACNLALGLFKDSESNLLAAVAYLKSGTDAGRGG